MWPLTYDFEIQQGSRGCRATRSYKIAASKVQPFMSYRAHKLFALSHNGEKSENPVLWSWPLTLKLSGCRAIVKFIVSTSAQACLPYLTMVKNLIIWSCDLDLWPMTLKINRVRAVVKIHVHAKCHQVACSGSWVIVLTKKKLRQKQYSPSLPRGQQYCSNNRLDANRFVSAKLWNGTKYCTNIFEGAIQILGTEVFLGNASGIPGIFFMPDYFTISIYYNNKEYPHDSQPVT